MKSNAESEIDMLSGEDKAKAIAKTTNLVIDVAKIPSILKETMQEF